MFALLLLAALAQSPKAGRVAVVAEPFVFEETLANSLSPADTERITFRIRAETPSAVDLLAHSRARSSSIELDMQIPRPGDAAALSTRLSSAACIVLEGGTWLDWWLVLRPYGKTSELGRALVRAHADGVHLVGVGSAGAHLAGSSILARDTLRRPSRDPHARSIDVVLGGMGVGGAACIDFATDGRVDPERLLEAAFDSERDLAVWLAGPCAWIVDQSAGTASVHARGGAACVFDGRGARRSRDCIEGVRVTRLTAGAVFDLAARAPLPAPRPDSERTVLNWDRATARSFFSPELAVNSWISGKAVELKGERHVLRIEFGAGPDAPRSDHANDDTNHARLDWKPIAR